MKTPLLLLVLFFSFSTSFSQINYSENWDSGTNINGWTTQNSTGNWDVSSTDPCQGNSPRKNIFHTASQGDFVSPNLGTATGGIITLDYDYKVIDWSGGSATPANFGSITVSYSNSSSGPWFAFDSVTLSNHVPSSSCANRSGSFNPPPGDVYVKFECVHSSGDYYIYFDEVSATESAPGSCNGMPSPGGSLSNTSNVCPADTISLNNIGATYLGGISTQWQSSTNNTSWSNMTGATTANYELTQNANTYYRYMVVCSNTGDTAYSNSVYVTMNPIDSCYCVPNTAQGCDDGDVVARIILNTLDNNSGNGCPSGTLGYSDYTGDTSLTTTLLPSNTYGCTIFAGEYAEGYAVWIDYNDDGFFDNSTERVGYSNGQIQGSGDPNVIGDSATFPVVLSCNPPAGVHRLRVRAMWNVNGINVTPCDANTYGETEDYLITIGAPPACPSPGLMFVESTSSNSAQFKLPLSCSNATIFDLEYDTLGFVFGTGTQLLAQTPVIVNDTATFTITGLSPSTTYSIYYKAICDSVNSSAWSSNIDFTTLCAASSAPYWIDSVDAHTPSTSFTNSLCWTANASSSYDWNIEGSGGSTPSNNTGPSSAYSGDNYFYTEASQSAVGAEATLTSPPLNLTAASPRLEFYYHMFGTAMGDLFVEIGNGSSWIAVDSLIADQHLDADDPWLLRSIDLSSFSGTIQVRFRAVSGGSYQGDICIDDIVINYCLSNAIDAGSDLVVCKGDTVTLNASGGTSYTWSNGVSNGQDVQIYSSEELIVTGIDSLGCSGTDTISIEVNNPSVYAGEDQTSCDGDTLVLSAEGGVDFVGPTDNSFGGGGYFQSGARCLIFDVFEDLVIKSVWVDADGQGTRTIELRDDNGTVLQDTIIDIPDGPSRVVLNFSVTAGTDYELGVENGSTPDLYRNNDNVDFPYKIPNVITIKESNANAALDYYYFFYDWEVQLANCCQGTTYIWSNGVVNNQAFVPTVSGEYILTAIDSIGCKDFDTVNVTIGANTTSVLNEVVLDSLVLNGQTYTQTGTYTQVLTNAAGCDSTITLNLTISDVGFTDGQLFNLSVHPNPTNHSIEIAGLDAIDEIESIYLVDSRGVIVKRLPQNENTLNLSSLSNGVYFLRINSSIGNRTMKIIKR